MAKRKAPASSASNGKKPKSANGTAKAAVKDDSAPASALDAVTSTIQSVATALNEVVEVAGDLVLDQPEKTPVPVSQVIEENIDVEEVKKQAEKVGKKVKGKAAQAGKAVAGKAEELEQEAEKKLEEKGVDVKGAKKKAGKAAKATKEVAEDSIEAAKPVVENVKENVKPLKGKAAKAAKGAKEQAEQVVEELQDPSSKKRKVAADFIESAEETVKAVAGKVGEVIQHVVEGFGEASGLISDLGAEAKEGKEGPATKKVKGKAEAVKKDAEEVVEGAKAKGKKAAEKVKETAAETTKEVKTRGKQAAKDAKDKVETDVAPAVKTRGKQAAEEAKTTGKRKAKETVAAAEPTAKKAKAKAEEVIEAAEPVVEKGKKDAKAAAKSAADTTAKAGKKAGKAANAAAAAAAEAVEDDDEDMTDGFESSDGEGADSSDDESEAEEAAVKEAGKKIDMSTLPSVAKDDKSVAARLKKAQKKKDNQKGTLYLGRIPHGFYEDQMKEYFSQFGDVTRLRLARNRKTGASKHYAYIEMSSKSVAEIVAETMNNYLLNGHLLKCQVIPAEEIHPELWQGANKKFRKVPRARVEKMRNERNRTDEEKEKADGKVLRKQEKRKANIKSKGIDYEFEGHK